MSGTPFERESKRARKRRLERERQLQPAGATTSAAPQSALRDVYSPAAETESLATDVADLREELEAEFVESAVSQPVTRDMPDAPESASEQVAALQYELQQKDELLHALTAQLEEAANRLDRLHRAGADRGPRVSAHEGEAPSYSGDAGKPLARLCGEWDELQLADQFETIRGRLDDIFDAVTLAKLEQGYGAPRVSEPASPRSTDSASKLPGWEDMKAQLLREGADKSRTQVDLNGAAADRVSDSEAEVLSDLPLEPPLPVDLDNAERDVLTTAIEERDVFISHLIRRLRSGTSGRYAPLNWAQISGAPDELRERLQEHEARLQELLRMEECDLSLERARLARERSRLEQLRRDLDRDARDRDGYGGHSDRDERRWFRVFGFGKKEASERA
jgi:hypothetical protein